MANKCTKIPPWIKGLMVGVLIWLYDYDFLCNAGGSETQISDYIHGFFGVKNSSASFPLVFLIIIGSIIGGFIGCIRKWISGEKVNVNLS